MADHLVVARSEFILGGQKSGKSRRAELLARDWLAQSPEHRAVLIATAQPWDDEMRERITRHQLDRAARVPGMSTVEEPLALADTVARSSTANTLIVVDCLTLWLTNLLMPAEALETAEKNGNHLKNESKEAVAGVVQAQQAMVLGAIKNAAGPVVLVGNEIGLGVIPLGRETRAFVDALGRLNQDVAAVCERVTLMAAGLPLFLKGQP
ncbi:MAG: bifunctional adenosylcobinamide kinase/adenosylcobinamide-phosphate guanylyltransferase [Pseudomonadota bacterium]